jgi:WD40 repeat protein
LCGAWCNDELVERHHQFLDPGQIQEHITHHHSQNVPLENKLPDANSLTNLEHSQSDFDRILPDELRLKIFQFLDLNSLVQCCRVSHEWYRLATDPKLWCFLHSKYWISRNQDQTDQSTDVYYIDWKQAVKQRFLLERAWRSGNCHASILRGHTGWVTCVDMYHNRLVSSSYDGTVRLWNTQTGNLLKILPSDVREGFSPVWCVQCKGSTIVSGSSDSYVRQWNMNTAQCLQVFPGHLGGVKCLQVRIFTFEKSTYKMKKLIQVYLVVR